MNSPNYARDLRLAPCTLALSCAALLLGCPSKPPTTLEPAKLLDPVALDAQLLLVDTANDRAVMLDVGPGQMGQRRVIALPPGSQRAERRNAQNEALVLSVGRRAQEDLAAEPAALLAIDGGGAVRSYTLGNPFDRLAQSDDGRYALLFKTGASMHLLDNPNEIAIVDLSLAPDAPGAITLRTLRSFGDSPASVVFSPMMRVAGEPRRLAVVLSNANVTLLDLNHLDRRETTVELASSAGKTVSPRGVVFHPSQPELYVRADSNDLYVFNLRERRPDEPAIDDGATHNDFRPFIDQLGIGAQPTDVKTYADGTDTRVLVLAGSAARVALVDPERSEVTSVAMPATATQALLFVGASPSDRERSERALLYQPGSNMVQFLDLVDLAARGMRNLEPLALDLPVVAISEVLDGKRVVVTHDRQGVSLIDLEARTVTLIRSNANLVDARYDNARQTLWFGPRDQPYVGLLDLNSGSTSEILLSANVAQFVPVLAARRLAVIHASDAGLLSLIDADNPTPEHTTLLEGFLR